MKNKISKTLKWEGKKRISDCVLEHENTAVWEGIQGKCCCELAPPQAASGFKKPLISHSEVRTLVFFPCHEEIYFGLSLQTSQLALWQVGMIINLNIFC